MAGQIEPMKPALPSSVETGCSRPENWMVGHDGQDRRDEHGRDLAAR